MTTENAKNMLFAKMHCIKRRTSGIHKECNDHNCDECELNYSQGNMGEQIQALERAIKALELLQILDDVYLQEMLKTPDERGVKLSDKKYDK